MRELEKGHRAEDVRLGTIDIVQYLLELHPDIKFSLLLGADTYHDLKQGKWKGGLDLFHLVSIIVIQRQGITSEGLELPDGCPDAVVRFTTIPALNDTSSTSARATKDEKYLATMLFPSTLEYVKQHKLYEFAST